jgi:meiotically up-regulated gene 157 (Mug157) protein
MGGYGYPAKPNGLICSMFRPSDDATIYPYLIPSNIFAVSSLHQMATMMELVEPNETASIYMLASQVEEGLLKVATVKNTKNVAMYSYETNGYGSYNLMDDANVPSLLSLSYLLGNESKLLDRPTYNNTRKFVLSEDNPFYFKGTAGEGIGGPHVGTDMIWPISIIMRGLTSTDEAEIKNCLAMLQHTHAGTGFMHESFHKDDATKFTRPWFAWANTIFGYAAWAWLLSKHPAAVVGPAPLLVPIFGMGAAAYFLSEPLPFWKILAASLVIAGLIINLFWPNIERSLKK